MVRMYWPISMSAGVACLAIALLLPAVPAAAQGTQPTEQDKEQALRLILQRFDGNADGAITEAEFLQAGQRDFAVLDADRDSAVTKGEFVDPDPRGAGKLDKADLEQASKVWSQQFGMLDADKNGQISPTEYDAVSQRSFTRMDADKDRRLTLAEMRQSARW